MVLSALRSWGSPSVLKVVISSTLSSVITGFATYLTITVWLRIMIMPIEVYLIFIAISTALSATGSMAGFKLWQRLPKIQYKVA